VTSDRGVVLVNPASGTGTDLEALRRAFEGHDVIECDPDSFDRAIDDVLDGGSARFVAMAGGDGSMRALATVLAGRAMTMLTIPEGTRNHLARDLGIATLEDAVAAATDGTETAIDLGEVNDEVFVNTMSLGVYPAMVRDRARRAHRLPKAVANLLAAGHQIRHGRRSIVEIDGRQQRVWSVFVGNGRYGTGVADLTTRDDLADGLLDVRVVRADRRLARTRVVLATLLGRLDRSPLVESQHTSSLTIDADRPVLDVALDGEVVQLDAPLRVSCRRQALRVLVPGT
jgi:diacylglycerol kinase family enzyme